MKTKSVILIVFLFALLFGAGCKKKEAPVEILPPPPVKQTEQEAIKGLISNISQLEPGKVITVQIDKGKVISEESELSVSLFPLEFISPAERPYIAKYMFPSVVWRYDNFQLEVLNWSYYLDLTIPGEKIWILKDSPDPKKPFEHIPTLLVETMNKDKSWVLDQNGDEMRLR